MHSLTPDTMAPVVSVTQHYATHLAPVYEWLSGGLEAAVARAAAELTGLGLLHRPRCQVVDLGAGFGAHSLALARAGHAVLALDTSALLLQRLQQAAHDQAVTTIAADLLEFRRYLAKPADLILCMGDTLTHLPEHADVARLITEIVGALGARGVFIATFRDYSQALSGVQRFIPVKSDAHRILTCFLEFAAEHVFVHDVLHERHDEQWRVRVSAYSKLRLAPTTLCAQLRAHGLQERQEAGPAGMVRIVASPMRGAG
jgi:2-polyprenyl-3-methyl-5-hydroxy-6-metoxy-1,4-benzoquinol methylase